VDIAGSDIGWISDAALRESLVTETQCLLYEMARELELGRMQRIRLVIDSNLEHVALVGGCISRLCALAGLTEMRCFQVETCVAEAVNNAIFHAYDNQPGREVVVTWSLDATRIQIEVSDRGRAMDLKRLPLSTVEVPGPDAEHGRGWYIMHAWMDAVAYSSEGGINTLTMSKNLPAA
jgi:serine/threonine-protein kinase RsbW